MADDAFSDRLLGALFGERFSGGSGQMNPSGLFLRRDLRNGSACAQPYEVGRTTSTSVWSSFSNSL
jgi:hypothetical protein